MFILRLVRINIIHLIIITTHKICINFKISYRHLIIIYLCNKCAIVIKMYWCDGTILICCRNTKPTITTWSHFSILTSFVWLPKISIWFSFQTSCGAQDKWFIRNVFICPFCELFCWYTIKWFLTFVKGLSSIPNKIIQ
jgi:hypothetical protein